MFIQYLREWIPTTEEDYKSSIYKRKDNSLTEICKEYLSELEFNRKPIYKEPGLKSVMNDEIIGYKYYRLGEPRGCLICSERAFRKTLEAYLKWRQ